MKLDLLREVADAISRELRSDGYTSTCHYFFDEKWNSLTDSSLPMTSATILALGKSVNEPISYRPPKSRSAWFHLKDLDATISVDFQNSPKQSTRLSVRKRIEEIKKNAMNAFRVNHNELTGLLSRDAFRQELQIAIGRLNSGRPKGFVLASEGLLLDTVSVLAFDIDKFKQVNDTYGHIYGDQVLKAFAWRLEQTANIVKTQFSKPLRIHLGHPSGEEFLVLIDGALANDDLVQIAEQFRLRIADENLPSDQEWSRLSTTPGVNKVQLPPKSQRTITTSVGAASYSGTTPGDTSATLMLLDKADIALYKSKSGGRNRVTQFEEILQKCGRVLEHDTTTGVVALDIGNKVGVSVGQELRVFPPTYSGQTAFMVDDGRSTRTLGTYPKIEICKIVVFDSQTDISFARVATQSSGGLSIPIGALLEAVPLGNITHLLERPHSPTSLVMSQEPQLISGGGELQDHLEQLVQQGKEPFAAVFRFKSEHEFHKKYGSAALNRAIAQLFSILRSKYSVAARLGLIDTTAICVIGEKNYLDIDELSLLLKESYQDNSELEPICGLYTYSAIADEVNNQIDQSQLDPHAIDLARYSLSNIEGFAITQIQTFSIAIAENIISQHRKSRAYASGISDYLRLKEIGITSADFENNGGLCYSAIHENSLALECYLRAVNLRPENIIFRGNAGILSQRTKQTDLGLKILAEIKDEKLDSLRKVHPVGFWAYAVLLAEARQANSPNFDSERMRKIGPAACGMENAAIKVEYPLVKSVVDELENPTD